MITKEKIYQMINDCKVSIISSVDSDGYPNTKAMLAPRKIDYDKNEFYFTTNTSSMRVGQYADNPKACVYFYQKGRFKYQGVMIIGTMEVLTDTESKNDIWRVGDTMFYKQGVSDPDYCVLKFKGYKCKYYCDFKHYWVDIE